MNDGATAPSGSQAAGSAGSAREGAPVEELARAFWALGNPIRLGILLAVAGGELRVTDLVGRFEVTQGAVSQHLRRLREEGLVMTRRAHKNVYYRLDGERVSAVLTEGLRHLAEARGPGAREGLEADRDRRRG